MKGGNRLRGLHQQLRTDRAIEAVAVQRRSVNTPVPQRLERCVIPQRLRHRELAAPSGLTVPQLPHHVSGSGADVVGVRCAKDRPGMAHVGVGMGAGDRELHGAYLFSKLVHDRSGRVTDVPPASQLGQEPISQKRWGALYGVNCGGKGM